MFDAIKKFFFGTEPLEENSPVYRASMPRAKVLATFTPLQNFEGYTPGGDLLGLYKKGKTYYIREGNNLLAGLCEQWKEENLIVVNGG